MERVHVRHSVFDMKPILLGISGIIILALLVFGILAETSVAPQSQALTSVPAKAKTPIQHIVIIMQENHAFDNYFGTFPGLAKGYKENLNVCMPISNTTKKGCVKPFDADNESLTLQGIDLFHSWIPSHLAFNNGSMNGFITGQLQYASGTKMKNFTLANATTTMGYYTNQTLPDYWDYASYYALDANFFSSTLSYSLPNHYYLVAARDDGLDYNEPHLFNLTYPTLTGELDAAGLSWRFYTGGWQDQWDCKPFNNTVFENSLDDAGFDFYWSPLADFPAVQQGPDCADMLNYNDLMQNLSSGYLPNVTWITPNTTLSEHPGLSSPLQTSQEYVSGIINAISSNPKLWNNTAIFLTWDEFGGYYDNVAPVQFDQFGYGFRVPLIVISPYVEAGKIFYGKPSGEQEDFSALLSTIEYNWGLANLTDRDGLFLSTKGLFYMFDFKQTPLSPLILPSNVLGTYPYSTCSTCRYGTNISPYSSPSPPTYPIPNDDPVDDS